MFKPPEIAAPGHWRLLATLVGLSLMAGCAEMPGRKAPAPAPAAASAPQPAASAPEPAEPVITAASPAPAPLPSITLAQVPKVLAQAIEALEQGQEDQAEPLLRQVLQADPNHRQAATLLKQIKDDPQVLYGRESFPFRVPAGETLSRIAQRFLNDPLQFYGLARYNNIKVPRQVGGGQMIRVPGKAPANLSMSPPSPPGPTPAPARRPPHAAAAGATATTQRPQPGRTGREGRA